MTLFQLPNNNYEKLANNGSTNSVVPKKIPEMGKIEFKRKCTIGIARGVGFYEKLICISVL